MLDARLEPRAALGTHASPGRYGAKSGPAGLTIQERNGLQIVSLAARRGQAAALASAIRQRWRVDLPTGPRFVEGGGVAFAWSGAERWLALTEADALDLQTELRAEAQSLSSITALGDGRVVLRLSGPALREALASVVPIDLDAKAFGPGDVALTLAGYIHVQIRQLNEVPSFEVTAFRSYAASLFDMLLEAGLRFGVEVLAPG